MATIRKNSDEATKEESMLEKATALAIGEMADCIEEVLIVEQETQMKMNVSVRKHLVQSDSKNVKQVFSFEVKNCDPALYEKIINLLRTQDNYLLNDYVDDTEPL